MSIVLSESEIAYLSSLVDEDGELTTELEDSSTSIITLTGQRSDYYDRYLIYKKFNDYWFDVTYHSEQEKKWLFGYYVTSVINDSELDKAVQDLPTCVIFPGYGSGDIWYGSEPKRIPSLYGTDSSGFEGCEYFHILEEENYQGIGETAERQAAQEAQRDALLNTISNLESFIELAEEQDDKYDFLSTLVSNAQSSLADSTTAYNNVIAALAAGSHAGRDLSARKSQITSRISQITTTMSNAYDVRYIWIDLLVNRINGVYNDYYGMQSTIDMVNDKIDSLTNQIEQISKFV